jgi:hypothetical protein
VKHHNELTRMTLAMAWIRTVGSHEEMVFASDSRLSGGSDWDCCPKLLSLPRGDSLLAFAGSTYDAYPMMLQFRNWVENNPGALNRARDITDLKKRMRMVFNDMRKFISDLPHGQTQPDPPDCELIFGGWSWKKLSFQAWRFHYVPSRGILDFEPVQSGLIVGRDHPIVFAGTRAAVEAARTQIVEMLKAGGNFRPGKRYFDMEPFEALRDIIRSNVYADVGGPPQVIKVYQHGNSQPFAVKWKMPGGRYTTVLGRPLFPGEQTRLPLIDPDAINFVPAKTLEKRARSAAAGARDLPQVDSAG